MRSETVTADVARGFYGSASEAEYYRSEFGDGPCPACGKTLDGDGRRHANGSPCIEAVT